MKYQRNSIAGLVMAIVFTVFFGLGILMILITSGVFSFNHQEHANVTPEIMDVINEYSSGYESSFQESKPIVPVVAWVFIGIGYLLIMTIALIIFIKGKNCERIMKYGKKGKCSVFNIVANRHNSYSMIVEYKGESGNMNKLMVPLSLKDVSLLKQGMVIECYIDKEDCYVDLKNIKEIHSIEEL